MRLWSRCWAPKTTTPQVTQRNSRRVSVAKEPDRPSLIWHSDRGRVGQRERWVSKPPWLQWVAPYHEEGMRIAAVARRCACVFDTFYFECVQLRCLFATPSLVIPYVIHVLPLGGFVQSEKQTNKQTKNLRVWRSCTWRHRFACRPQQLARALWVLRSRQD